MVFKPHMTKKGNMITDGEDFKSNLTRKDNKMLNKTMMMIMLRGKSKKLSK